MALSMTGYGSAEVTFANKKITVELRSLNSKQLDLNLKISSAYHTLEADLRAKLQALQRGKVDVLLFCDNVAPMPKVNQALFVQYLQQLQAIAKGQGGAFSISAGDILSLPDVINEQKQEVSEDEKAAIFAGVDQALKALTAFRAREGAVLMGDILQRVHRIEQLLVQVASFEQARIETIKNKMLPVLQKTVGYEQIDKNRFEQELIYYLEKLDVTEEKTRLQQHCIYFAETTKEDNSGRKLGFISQEMGREINTLGSKANHSQMQQIVVEMKDELEKIKEQLLNIL